MRKKCLVFAVLWLLLPILGCAKPETAKTVYLLLTETTVEKNSLIKSESRIRYHYDENHNPTAITFLAADGSQAETELEYDSYGQILRKHVYNSQGQLVESYRFAYDDRGNPVLEELLNFEGLVYTTRWIYDNQDRPLEKETVYSAQRSTVTFAYTYDDAGGTKTVRHLRDGVLSGYEETELDDRGRPRTGRLYHSDGSLYQRREYAYADLTVTVQVHVRNQYVEELWLSSTETYTYDTNGNLLSLSVRDTVSGKETVYTYTYQAIQISPDCPRKELTPLTIPHGR